VAPDDHDEAISRLLDLVASPELRHEMGTSGRRNAEATLDVAPVAVRFEKVLCEAVDADPNHQLGPAIADRKAKI
jgi:hypothetical protein